MNRPAPHPVELAIVAALVAIEALLVLVIAAAALLLTLAHWRPAAAPIATAAPEAPTPSPAAPLARPTAHPLALLADQLEALPAATLRQLAGVRSKRHNKAALIAMVAACS